MSTHLPGFQSLFRFFAKFCVRVRFHIELAGMRLYANDMVMRFLSRIRRLEKVAIDFCT